MRSLVNMELQRLAVLMLGVGYIVNAGADCLISLVRDGATNPVVINSLADNQHITVLALAGIATANVVVSFVQSRERAGGSDNGESTRGSPS